MSQRVHFKQDECIPPSRTQKCNHSYPSAVKDNIPPLYPQKHLSALIL